VKIKPIFLVVLSFLLVGCGTTRQEQARYKSEAKGAVLGAGSGALIGGITDAGMPLGAVIGGIVGGAAGQYWYNKKMDQLEQALAQMDAQLIVVGDKVRIILPADNLFAPNKDKLKFGAEYPLVALADYLREFEQVCITIAGYTDAMPNRANNIKFSTLRAQRIASFLWDQGFHEKCLKVIGYGQEQTIASNETIRGRAFNRRIEITLWQGSVK
jgi:outer membrane protein OmpA-like peptidoglycan-associated protein